MKNKFSFLYNSIKQSITNKPIAFILLFLVFFATTICCSMPSRWLSAGLNEEYSQSNYISFKISYQDFKQNKIAIGDFIRDNVSTIVYDEEEIVSYINVNHYNAVVSANDTYIAFENLRINFVITQNYGITENNIINKENVVSIKESVALKYGIKIGNKINIYGNDLTVINLHDDYYDFAIPYNIQINEWYSCSPPIDEVIDATPTENIIQGSIKNIKYSAIKFVKKSLKQFNCTFNAEFNFGVFICVILVMSMLAICMLSSISIMGYWLKCNSKKYAIYKTLGCNTTLLAYAMIIETLLIAIFAIGLGLIVDYFIGINMKFEMPLASFTWLHYFLLISCTLISAIVMVVIAVVKRAIAMPANTKYNE